MVFQEPLKTRVFSQSSWDGFDSWNTIPLARTYLNRYNFSNTVLPPTIVSRTSISLMDSKFDRGFSARMTRSAILPFSMEPIFFSWKICQAASMVTARNACMGGILYDSPITFPAVESRLTADQASKSGLMEVTGVSIWIVNRIPLSMIACGPCFYNLAITNDHGFNNGIIVIHGNDISINKRTIAIYGSILVCHKNLLKQWLLMCEWTSSYYKARRVCGSIRIE